MYALGHVAELISAINMAIGMMIAHTLYKSPKKFWRCVITWLIIFAVCIPLGEVLNGLLPQYAEQRIASFVGCIFIFGYMYLFPNIPMPQRIFNYFLAVDFMYLILLISRTTAMLLVGGFAFPPDLTVLICYLIFSSAFCVFYFKWLRNVVRTALAAFRENLTTLTIFSVICYFGSLFLIDAWAPWPALGFHSALPNFGLMAVNICGYVLAFRTLATIGQRFAAEAEAKMAQLQLALAEKEYQATMEGIDQVRRLRHDMSHHLSALSALIENDDKANAMEYIKKTSALLPQRVLSEENLITGSFVEHYRELCAEENIDFSAQMSYDENRLPNKAHLGILLGNSLQNAFDAARKAEGARRFIAIEGKRVYDNLVIVVKNGYAGELDPELRSSKGEGHGLGLNSMRGVTEEYGGYLEATQEDGVFTLNLVLTIKA
ncbi:MAG: GHKL domain-containing protein [Oscillospiraceae bacterium]